MTTKIILATTTALFLVGGIAMAQPIFKEADTDGDGNLSKAEVTAQIAKQFAKFDKDGDGKVTQQEREEGRNERIAKRFARIDKDGNGAITLEEMQAAAEKFGHHAGKGHHGRIDLNKDGVIEKTEIEAHALNRFERMDSNHDGVVSADERATAHPHFKGKDRF